MLSHEENNCSVELETSKISRIGNNLSKLCSQLSFSDEGSEGEYRGRNIDEEELKIVDSNRKPSTKMELIEKAMANQVKKSANQTPVTSFNYQN